MKMDLSGSAIENASPPKPGKPHLSVHQVPSRGRSSRILQGGSVRHLLSDLETRLLTELEWSEDVGGIQEQYALPLHATQKICDELGLHHPKIPKTGEPAVMSTDFFFELKRGRKRTRHARAVKSASEFDLRNPKRVRAVARLTEKLEIERRYWEGEGVEWRLVTDRDLDRVRCLNIRLFLSGNVLDPHEGAAFWEDALTFTAGRIKAGSDRPLSYLARKAEAEGKLLERQFVACVRHMCATRVLSFNMSQEFSPALRACDFEFAGAG